MPGLVHLFFYRPYVARLWTEIQNWLKTLYIEFAFTPFCLLFGLLDEDSTQLMNTIILLAKILIFKAQSKKNLNLRCVKSRLKTQFILERMIAAKNQKVAQHTMKWEIISSSEEWDKKE